MTALDWALFLIVSLLHLSAFQAQVGIHTDGFHNFLLGVFFSLCASVTSASVIWWLGVHQSRGPNGLTTAALICYLLIGSAGMMDMATQHGQFQV